MTNMKLQGEETVVLTENDSLRTVCNLDSRVRNQELSILVLDQQTKVQSILNAMEQLENSQLGIEKKAFDNINCSDTMLNAVKEGVNTILGFLNKISNEYNLTCEAETIHSTLLKIVESAHQCNDMCRRMEHEIAFHRDITDNAKNAADLIAEVVERTGYYFEEYD